MKDAQRKAKVTLRPSMWAAFCFLRKNEEKTPENRKKNRHPLENIKKVHIYLDTELHKA
jgi:hypothetical protein